MRWLVPSTIAAALLSLAASADAAPELPRSAHPRLFLDAATLTTLRAQAKVPSSAAARAIAQCRSGVGSKEVEHAIYQGENWARFVASCGLAWNVTRDPALAGVGVRAFRGLLDDYLVLGDGKGGDEVVRHDTGYAMRFFAAYAGLGYDWLHDAPDFDDALREKARRRFAAWVGWYDEKGYLRHVPGSNYEAGYLYAKTLIAVASAGESPHAASWLEDVVGNLVAKDIVGKGLGEGGALVGGDWPEGWQYGGLSALEMALVTRALDEQKASSPALHAWASDVVVRYLYALTPSRDGLYVGGDTEAEKPYMPPIEEPLLAAMIAGSDEAASWAAAARESKNVPKDAFPALEAIAESRGAPPIDFNAAPRPLAYLARGTRTLFARSSWDPSAVWTVFSSAPRLVPDHQHFDASSFVLSRGSDPLVVDPAPYGSRSTTSSNALAIESVVPPEDWRGVQTPDGKAELLFAKATVSGVVAARSDLRSAFAFRGATDVRAAMRDFVVLPEGEVVVVDRADTGADERGATIAFRSVAKLARRGEVVEGTTGASRLVVHAPIGGGGAEVRTPKVVGDASGPPWNVDEARLPVTEYRVHLPGPTPFAIHVLDALGASEPAADVRPLPGDARGIEIRRGGSVSFVVTASDGAVSYGASGQAPARHVVLVPPGTRAAKVTASARGDRCEIAVAPASSGLDAHPLVFRVSAASDGCRVADDPVAPFGGVAGGTTPVVWARPEVADGVTRSPLLLAARRIGKKKLVAAAGAASFATALIVMGIARVLRRRSRAATA